MKRLFAAVATWIATAGVFAAVGWFARGLMPAESRVGAVCANVPAVAAGEVASEIFNPPEEFVGHIEPVQEVDLLPQIDGYLQELRFSEGDQVKAGDLLFVIDPERYAAADALAKASLAQALRERVCGYWKSATGGEGC